MNEFMKVGETLNARESITSLEIVREINLFREQEKNRSILKHSDLLKIIRDEFENEINEGKISSVKYKDAKGEERPMFELTYNQAKQVLVRESKFVRKAFISYVDKLENKIRERFYIPRTLSEALRLAADQADKIEKQEQIINMQAPKVAFFDAVADSRTAISVNDVSKVLAIDGFGRNRLFEFLRNKKVLMNNNRPYQQFIDLGYFRVVEQRFSKNGEDCINIKTLVYQKGVEFIKNIILNHKGIQAYTSVVCID